MNAYQLEIFQPDEINVGDVVWWTWGLRYLTRTYKYGTPVSKFRPEHIEQVKVLEISEPNNSDNRTYISELQDREQPIHTCRRWISTDPSIPCEAIFEAYGRWGN